MSRNKNDLLHVLAKKYAKAFINVYGAGLTIEDYQLITQAVASLQRNKRLIFFLNLSAIDPVVKALSVEQIAKKYQLPDSIKKLCYFLLEQNRLSLICLVFEYITIMYRKKANIEEFSIISSHALPDTSKEAIKQFLAAKTNKTIIYTSMIDPSLVAGLRLQSSSLLWEHSIAKQLKSLELSLIT